MILNQQLEIVMNNDINKNNLKDDNMIKSEYNLSLSNDNITLNRVDELDHFLNTYYPEKYQEIKNIYKFFNPLFAILTFLSIPIQTFAINTNFIIGAITTALTFVILITLYIYSDQKPRQMKKDIFTDIFENFKFYKFFLF